MKRNIRWIVSQIGAREHYAVPRALNLQNELSTFYTDLWTSSKIKIPFSGTRVLKGLMQRNHKNLPGNKVVSYNTRFLRYELAERINILKFKNDFEKYIYYGSKFARVVTQDLKKQNLDPLTDVFFGFNTTSLETIQYLKPLGIQTIVDQIDPGKLEMEMVIEESSRWPGWSETEQVINPGYFSRLSEEWNLASKVVVNSNWSKQALIKQNVPAEKIIVIPLAYEPAEELQAFHPISALRTEELNVLWFGNVILRKGIQYLIEAAKILKGNRIHFTIAGPVGITDYAVRQAPDNMTFLGRIQRADAGKYYRNADVFVLPTLSDGFAITQIEAMSFGLPVITTSHCGEVVTDGLNGYIVNARDGEDLADKILRLYKDRPLLNIMSDNAKTRSSTFTIKNYRDNLYGNL